MATANIHQTFETSAALALLDKIIEHPAGRAMPAARIAWESAWIACLTNCPGWAATAERDFQKVLLELSFVLWPARDGTLAPHLTTERDWTLESSYPSAFRPNPIGFDWTRASRL